MDEWLRMEAHIIVGQPFHSGDCICVPVAPEVHQHLDNPLGFLVTHGSDIAFVEAPTPEGREFLSAWEKVQLMEILEEMEIMPSE